MNNIDSNKIDLVEEIRKSSNIIRESDNHQRKSAFNYFLTEDLTRVFGKTVFDKSDKEEVPDEIEVTRTRGGLLIGDLDGRHYRVVFRNDGLDFHEVILEDGNMSNIKEVIPLFTMTLTPIIYTNTLKYKGEINEKTVQLEDTYEMNRHDLTFNFKSREANESPYYEGSVSSLNAKFGSHEMVNYIRMTPPYPKVTSISKRICNYFKVDKMDRGECIISLATSDSLTDLVDYSDTIFNILKKEAKKVIKPTNERNLQKVNEEN